MNKYDLVVCGGGTAGVAAAYIGAKYGLKTLIVEKNIHLGGSITSALVVPAMKSNNKNINCEFFNDFVVELKKYNAQVTYTDGNKGWFNPELAKIALDSLLSSVGCDILFDSDIKNVEFSNQNIKSIEITSKGLSLYIESNYFVDSTGDGNFSYILKNKFLENNSNRQPMSLRFHISGIDMESFSNWIMNLDTNRDVTSSAFIDGQIHLSTAYTWDKATNWALRPIFEKAIDNGDLKLSDSAYFQLFTIPGMPNTVTLNCPRLLCDGPVDPLDTIKFSSLVIEGRQQIWRLYNFLKKYFVGFENSYISNIADMVGIRESRRVCCKQIYTKNDLLSGKTYENPVLHADYPIDIHSYNKDAKGIEKLTVDYELPIECLISDDFDNLFVAGRIVSADFDAQAALRIQSSCFSMGEAVAKHIVKLIK